MSVVFSILLRIKFCILDKQIINKGELKMNVENILRENIITDCIRIPIIEMINKNADEFDKYLSMEISGTEDLKILNYNALKADSDKICLEIKADTSIFRKNYQKRTMNPEKRIQLFEDTVLEKLSSETNDDIYNTWIESLDVLGIPHTGFSMRKKEA